MIVFNYKQFQKIPVNELRKELSHIYGTCYTVYNEDGMTHILYEDGVLHTIYISSDENMVLYGLHRISMDDYKDFCEIRKDFIVPFQGCNLWRKSIYDFLNHTRTRPKFTDYQDVVHGWDNFEIYNLIKIIKARL